MNLRRAVTRVLRTFGERLTLVEDTAAAVQSATGRIEAAVARIEAAVAEQGQTIGGAFEAMRDERERRAGLGREVMSLSSRLDRLEREPNGAAR